MVIPMWNQIELTRHSVRRLGRAPDRVIVADNGSQVDTRASLDETLPGVFVLWLVRENATVGRPLIYGVYTAGNLLKALLFRWRRGELQGYRMRLRGPRPVPLEDQEADQSPVTM
jgi:hypothetical protein